jgi:DNA (cytosine-5)-methyltransferase 1
MSLNVLSLFSGIGGLELGLERAGCQTVGQVELDPFCMRQLAHHWPDVPRHDDVRTAPEWWISEERPTVDVVCGGFPCQPFSSAGHRRGVGDERWGWPWMERVIRVARPRYVVVENVAAFLDHPVGFGWMLADLSALGFNAEWSVVSACSMGAPHTRDRLFLVAYSDCGDGQTRLGIGAERQGTLQAINDRARAWRDRVDGSLAASRSDGRETDGLPRRMVGALGNAVVPAVSYYVGKLIVNHDIAGRAA